MTMEHVESHEQALEKWVAREALSSAEEEAIAGCEECRRRCEELQSMMAELEAEGDRERETRIEQAHRATPPTWEEEALGTLKEAMDRAPLRALRLSRVLQVAAGLLLCVGLYYLVSPEQEEDTPRWMGDQTITDMAPSGDSAPTRSFRWRAELPPMGEFQLLFFEEGEDTAFLVRTSLQSPWIWDSQEPLPDRFTWEVKLFDALGEELAARRSDVRFSP